MMETASFTGFVRTLLWILCAYYVLKFLMRLLAPYLFQQVVKKAEENFNKQQEAYRNQQQGYQNTNSSATNHEMPKEKKKVGEYIDYEEID